jgi:hypothetical protein
LKALASKFTDDFQAVTSAHLDEKQVLDHIKNTSDGKPVVLLVDELNLLNLRLSKEVCELLKFQFLDVKGRYLIFSTHLAMNTHWNDILFSQRAVVSIVPPKGNNLNQFQQLPNCRDVTRAQVAICGGIPSLVYCSKKFQGANQTFEKRFEQAGIEISAEDPMKFMHLFGLFVDSVVTGTRHGEISMFERFGIIDEQQKIKWPLCFISVIANKVFEGLGEEMTKIINSINVQTHDVQSGKDWEQILLLSFYFKALRLQYHGKGNGPLDIRERKEKYPAKGVYPNELVVAYTIPLPGEGIGKVHTVEQAKEFILGAEQDILLDGNVKCFCAVFTPSFAKFPTFDGFISYSESNRFVRFAYQAKEGKKIPPEPSHELNLDWLGHIYHLGGDPPKQIRKFDSKWTRLNLDEILSEMGYSFKHLVPVLYPELASTEELEAASAMKATTTSSSATSSSRL